MVELSIALIALAVVGFIAYPLVTAKPADELEPVVDGVVANGTHDRTMSDLLNQRDTIYRAIKEIEFDHQLGNLSDVDYTDLRDRYKGRALPVLKAIHDLESTASGQPNRPSAAGEADDSIELAIQKRRAQAKRSHGGGLTCGKCGVANQPGHRFCVMCGEPLALVCSACGQPHGDGARFCAHCGASLVETVQGAPRRV
ncbi:MAG: zinc ribbon domain-containing protein [Chloroflexota bacterium]